MKEYKIYLENELIGKTKLEKADPPMEVVLGAIQPMIELNYNFLKNFCKLKNIEIADEFPDDKFISTMNSDLVKITDENDIEIKGVGNQISGMDKYGYEITILGVPYPFYNEEFPHHVKDYEHRMGKNDKA